MRKNADGLVSCLYSGCSTETVIVTNAVNLRRFQVIVDACLFEVFILEIYVGRAHARR
jgi:hypothetical protein